MRLTSHLPELPDSYAWLAIEARHAEGVTYWLRITGRDERIVAGYGWPAGYTPSLEQLASRARTMLEDPSMPALAAE